MTLTIFALVAAASTCAAQDTAAVDSRAGKSPLVALADKVKEVALTGETAEKDRALLSKGVEKVTGAVREGDFCGALNGLEVFKFHVRRFSRFGGLKDAAGGRELLSLAEGAARRIRESADLLGADCPASK